MKHAEKDEFFDEVKRWSERKHRLLGKYLPPFTAKVGSWAHEIYCVDAFAGAARYEDGKEGSPLLMARLSDTAAAWSNPVTLRLINIEKKPAHYKSLCEATAPWVERGIVINKKGSFGDKVTEILRDIGTRPALFFLDPYGPTKIYFRCLLPILNRQVSATELIINFNAYGLRRLGNLLHTQSRQISENSVEKVVNHVTSIMGDDGWKQDFIGDEFDNNQREVRLVERYVNTLNKFGYHVVAYPIREAIGSHPKYYLIFCSRHVQGVTLMNSFICEEEDQMLDEDTNDNLPLFMSAGLRQSAQAVEDRRILLREYFEEYLEQHGRTTRGEIKQHVIFKHFGRFHDKDFTKVAQDMVNEGVLVTGHGRKRFNDSEPLTYVPPSTGESKLRRRS